MSTALQLFSYSNKKIRTVIIDGVVWWVAKDVCLLLGYKDHNSAIKQHCRGVVKYHPIVDSIGRTQDTRIINISDLTRLITQSELPEATKFELWVHEQVLPSVLKTGSYSIAPQQPSIPTSFSEALQLAADQAKQIEQMQPKVLKYDKFLGATTTITMTVCAKLLGINPNRFFKWLREIGACYKNNTQIIRNEFLKNGWFVQKIFAQEVPKDGTIEIHPRGQARVTMKGLDGLEKLAKEHGLIPQDYIVERTPEKLEEFDKNTQNIQDEALDLTSDDIQVDIDRLLGE